MMQLYDDAVYDDAVYDDAVYDDFVVRCLRFGLVLVWFGWHV